MKKIIDVAIRTVLIAWSVNWIFYIAGEGDPLFTGTTFVVAGIPALIATRGFKKKEKVSA